MKLRSDLHTHTIASGHAYNTIREMAKAAGDKGLELLGICEHTPGVYGCCDPFYFANIKVIPRELYGVKLLLGGEMNIIDYNGSLSLGREFMQRMDLRIAGIHKHCYTTGTPTQNNDAVLAAMANPWIDAICHPDDGALGLDYEALVDASVRYGTLLEVNNNALDPRMHRKNAHENMVTMLNICKRRNVPVLVDSDAHFDTDIARCDFASMALEEACFPDELIANNHMEIIYEVIRAKRRALDSLDKL